MGSVNIDLLKIGTKVKLRTVKSLIEQFGENIDEIPTGCGVDEMREFCDKIVTISQLHSGSCSFLIKEEEEKYSWDFCVIEYIVDSSDFNYLIAELRNKVNGRK